MPIVGYTDRWSVQAGQSLSFYLSTEHDYAVTIVRLIHGDENPLGPGFKSQEVERLPATFPAHRQDIRGGSYVRFEPDAAFPRDVFTVSMWICPTLFGPSTQGLYAAAGGSILLAVDADGRILWTTGSETIVSPPIEPARWTFVQASVDREAGRAALTLRTRDYDPRRPASERHEGRADGVPRPGLVLVGAVSEDGAYRPSGCFNGRIGKVRVDAAWLAENLSDAPRGTAESTALEWHFGLDVGSRRAVDISRHRRHGEVVNRPTRGVKGAAWSGHFSHFKDAPNEYDAIHFHADDLEDCRWAESFAYAVPQDLKSGIYAAAVLSDLEIRYLPFAVVPAPHAATARIAVLLPTISYMAYSNEALDPNLMPALCPLRVPDGQADDYAYIASNRIASLYDRHADGSGRCMVTTLRPNLTAFNPLHRSRLFNGPHQLGADLHLIDWLEATGFEFDVITDHELHDQGIGRLAPYSAVLSGSHAEYWTTPMLDALGAYQRRGGRFVYLSGNGLYWVTAIDGTGTVAEIRRFGGTESWTAPGGETTISLSGEQGGLWKDRGRAPQVSVGVGMAAQGFDRGAPYQRTAASHDPRAAFIFAGIDDDMIGDFPALVMTHGAAGYEVDRLDMALGTPAHALLLASSTSFSDSYQFVREDSLVTTPYDGGCQNPNVRADMVYYENANGGAVFSVGSISFCSTLSYANYRNNVSRLLENVVTAFADPSWMPALLPGDRAEAPTELESIDE